MRIAHCSSEFPLIDNVVGRRTSNNPVAPAMNKRRPR